MYNITTKTMYNYIHLQCAIIIICYNVTFSSRLWRTLVSLTPGEEVHPEVVFHLDALRAHRFRPEAFALDTRIPALRIVLFDFVIWFLFYFTFKWKSTYLQLMYDKMTLSEKLLLNLSNKFSLIIMSNLM